MIKQGRLKAIALTPSKASLAEVCAMAGELHGLRQEVEELRYARNENVKLSKQLESLDLTR